MEYYHKNVQTIPGLELVFYSLDDSEAEQKSFMEKGKVDFPAVEFKSVGEKSPLTIISKLAGDSVPQFVLINGDGKKLYDSEEEPTPEKLKELAK